jgi:hypothetical protein
MKAVTTRLLVAAILVVGLATCSKQETPTTDTTPTTEPSTADTVSASQNVTANTLTIKFGGLIAQIFHAKEKKNRAVLVRDSEHVASLYIPASRTSKTELEKIWTGANEVDCDADWCKVPLDGWAVQFASNGTVVAQPSSVAQDTTFKHLVPNLHAVSGSSKFKEVKKDVISDDPPAPATNTLISSWVALPDGSMSATAYPATAKFDPDHEPKGQRQFAKYICLNSTIPTPTVQVSKVKGKWETVPIAGSGPLELGIFNSSTATDHTSTAGSEHFAEFYKLASGALTSPNERPRIGPLTNASANADNCIPKLDNKAISKRMQTITGDVHFTLVEVPGCSNSTWP